MEQKKILVVDDEIGIVKFIEKALTKSGYFVKTTTSPLEAINILKTHNFNLVITDLRMPGMDGIELLKIIKTTYPKTEVIIMSAYATVETAIEGLKIGAYDYLIKPFDIDEFNRKIHKCLKEEIKEKQTILVVDDDLTSADVIKHILTSENYNVTTAEDGETAIKKTRELMPDLVIMDIMLPGINGWQASKILKDDSRTSHIPIIILTGEMTKIEDEITSLKLGIDDYITRPCDTEVLLGRIKIVLRRTEKVNELKETVALFEISKAISSLMELDELLNLILKLAVEISNADGGSIMLYDPETDEFEIKTTYGDFEKNIIGRRVKFGERIVGTAAKERRPIIVHGHLKDDPRFKQLKQFDGIVSGMAVPMFLQEKLIGCITLKRTKKEGQFTERESNFLSIFASQVALFVENVSLHDQLKKHADDLEQKVQARTFELENAYKDLKMSQKTIIRTEKLRMIGQMATNIAHEFKNYLSIIKMSTEYCLLKLPLDEKVKKQLKTILENEELAYQSVKNLGAFAKPSDISLQAHQINDILDNGCRFMKIKCMQQKVEVVKDYASDLPVVMVDADQTQSVFMNLLINSLQASSIGGKIIIQTRYNSDTKRVTVHIKDSGSGITENNICNIFEPFFTTRMDGSGLGLTIAKQIIESQQGEISIYSKVGEGTTATVSFPVQNEIENNRQF